MMQVSNQLPPRVEGLLTAVEAELKRRGYGKLAVVVAAEIRRDSLPMVAYLDQVVAERDVAEVAAVLVDEYRKSLAA